MELTPRQKENLAKALFDIGKLIFAFIVLGPLASPSGFRAGLTVTGVVLTAVVFVMGTVLDKGR